MSVHFFFFFSHIGYQHKLQTKTCTYYQLYNVCFGTHVSTLAHLHTQKTHSIICIQLEFPLLLDWLWFPLTKALRVHSLVTSRLQLTTKLLVSVLLFQFPNVFKIITHATELSSLTRLN